MNVEDKCRMLCNFYMEGRIPTEKFIKRMRRMKNANRREFSSLQLSKYLDKKHFDELFLIIFGDTLPNGKGL